MFKEAGQPTGSFEEIEGVTARRRINHDQVEPITRLKFIELFHSHVFLGSAKSAREVAVDLIVEDALGLGRVG